METTGFPRYVLALAIASALAQAMSAIGFSIGERVDLGVPSLIVAILLLVACSRALRATSAGGGRSGGTATIIPFGHARGAPWADDTPRSPAGTGSVAHASLLHRVR